MHTILWFLFSIFSNDFPKNGYLGDLKREDNGLLFVYGMVCVLSEMGPEGQDIKVKVFVSGRRVGHISEHEQTTKKSPAQPPPTPWPPLSPQASAPPPQHTPSAQTPCHSAVPESSSHIDDTADGATGDTPTGRTDFASGHPRPSPSPSEQIPPGKKTKRDDRTWTWNERVNCKRY